jgi:hypothetical protein
MRTSTLILAACLLAICSTAAGDVYRWVDKDGKVHFTATLPPAYADKPYQVINDAGLVVREVDPNAIDPDPDAAGANAGETDKRPVDPQWTEEMVQIRSDRLLVLKYHSEEDIIEAMNVEIGNLDYDELMIEQSQASALKSMAGQIREAADRQRAGLPADPKIDKAIRDLQQRLRQGARDKEALRAREASIRAVFMAELERYRYLVSQEDQDL